MSRPPSPERSGKEIYALSRDAGMLILTFLPFVCTEGLEGDWLVLDDMFCDFYVGDDRCSTMEEVSIKASLKYGVNIDRYVDFSDLVTMEGHYVGREDHVERRTCVNVGKLKKI